jgi:hypothetical protein
MVWSKVRELRHCGRSLSGRTDDMVEMFARRMRVLSLLGVFVALAACVARAGAPALAATCPPPPTPLQTFFPWKDSADYVLTTGGSFESGQPAWTLSGGASLVTGNAPNALDKASDARSLFLPAGASATSACVTAPQIKGIVRFFARSTGGQLRVEILVKGGIYQAGTFATGSTWAPSPILPSNAPAYSGAVAYQVRLTALGTSGGFTVDDVYFDPYKSV